MSRFFSNRNSSTAVDNNMSTSLGNVTAKDTSLGVNSPSSLKQDSYLNTGSTYGSGLKQDTSFGGGSTFGSSTLNKEGQLLGSQQQQGFMQGGQYQGVVSSQTFPNQIGGQFSISRLEEQELLRRGEKIPGKVIQLGETGPFTLQHPEICIPQEKLLIKHQPISVAQPPVVIRPEPITIPQQPFVWQPEPIAIPLPPLTIQPEPIVIERPPLTVQPDAYVLHRPNLVLNPTFNVKLTYPGQCPPGSVCASSQGTGMSSAVGSTSTMGSGAGMSSSSLNTTGSSFSGTKGYNV